MWADEGAAGLVSISKQHLCRANRERYPLPIDGNAHWIPAKGGMTDKGANDRLVTKDGLR